MKHVLLLTFIISFQANAQAWKGVKKAVKKATTELTASSSFSEAEAKNAIKEVLNIGVEKGVTALSLKNGFYGDKNVKIPFPKDARNVADKLNKMGQQKQVDACILSINRAAEDAVRSAMPIFADAINKMSVEDGIGIIKGGKTAGTDYLKGKTNDELISAFEPIIKNSLKKVDATKYWKSLITFYNKVPFVEKVNPKLENYVTEKTIDGMFFMLAKEELRIREKEDARTSSLLRKVFGD